MEGDDAIAQNERQKVQQRTGRSFLDEGVMAYSPEHEATIEALPAYTAYRKPLQDPDTGAFHFMLDVDGLDGGAPLQ